MNTTSSETPTDPHAITINCEPPSHSGALVTNGGFRASCSCHWSSDCYAQLTDTQRAVEVHLRKARRLDFEGVIARSSIGGELSDIKHRGIDAHLADLAREMRRRRPRKAKRANRKVNPEDAAFMRGFGAALASIWHCQHDRQLIRQLLTANNFTLASFKSVGMLDADLLAIRQALQR